MNKDPLPDIFKKGFLVLGILAAAGLVGYGLSYLIVMPRVSPGGFVPTTLENNAGTPSLFGTVQAIFAFAPVPIFLARMAVE